MEGVYTHWEHPEWREMGARELREEKALGAMTAHDFRPPEWLPAPPWDVLGSACMRLGRPASSLFSYLPYTLLFEGRGMPRKGQGVGGGLRSGYTDRCSHKQRENRGRLPTQGRHRGSLGQGLQDGIHLLRHSCQGKFKLVLERAVGGQSRWAWPLFQPQGDLWEGELGRSLGWGRGTPGGGPEAGGRGRLLLASLEKGGIEGWGREEQSP